MCEISWTCSTPISCICYLFPARSPDGTYASNLEAICCLLNQPDQTFNTPNPRTSHALPLTMPPAGCHRRPARVWLQKKSSSPEGSTRRKCIGNVVGNGNLRPCFAGLRMPIPHSGAVPSSDSSGGIWYGIGRYTTPMERCLGGGGCGGWSAGKVAEGGG